MVCLLAGSAADSRGVSLAIAEECHGSLFFRAAVESKRRKFGATIRHNTALLGYPSRVVGRKPN
jgi:hypothetical protein